MLKSILVTAGLLAAWSVAWFVNVVYLGNRVTSIVNTLDCRTGGPGLGNDDGTVDIVIWVIGLVAIVGLRSGALSRAVQRAVSRAVEIAFAMRRVSFGILVVCGLAGAMIAFALVVTARNGGPPDAQRPLSYPVGTARTVWAVAVNPATCMTSWKRTDLGVDGHIQETSYLSPGEAPVPWLATIPLTTAVPIGTAVGLLVGETVVFLRRPRSKSQLGPPR